MKSALSTAALSGSFGQPPHDVALSRYKALRDLTPDDALGFTVNETHPDRWEHFFRKFPFGKSLAKKSRSNELCSKTVRPNGSLNAQEE